MPATRIRFSSASFTLLLAYLFFCFLMLEIVLQYLHLGTDTAFLNIKQEYIHLPYYLPAFYIHVFTAILALPAGFTQFSPYILRHHRITHRINGRIYIITVLFLGAPSGFIIGIYASGGLYSQISFCLLAVLWALFTLIAWRKAIARQFTLHKAFMYRSFALTLSAITLRGWKYLLTGFFHFHPMDAYRIVSWLGWTLNLVIAEFIIYKKLRK